MNYQIQIEKMMQRVEKEILKFLRRKGRDIQALVEENVIYDMILTHLRDMNLANFMDYEAVEKLIDRVSAEDSSITPRSTVNIDPFKGDEFSKYCHQKLYASPDQILKHSLRNLEGERARHNDEEIIHKEYENFVILSEDEDYQSVNSEAVIQSIQTAKRQIYWNEVHQQMQRENDPVLHRPNLEQVLEANRVQVANYQQRWEQNPGDQPRY